MMISNFSTTYREAMRAQAPAMFNELTRSGEMQEHVRQKAMEASRMLGDLLPDGRPEDGNAYHAAVEQVLAVMLEFPQESQETT